MNRRELFRKWVRGALGAGLAAVSFVALRGRRAGAVSHTCTGGGICRGCDASSECVLPQALSYRNAAGKRE